MKNLNFLSNLWGQSRASQSSDVGFDCRLTVGSPSGFGSKSLLKLVSVLVLILTIGSGNAWGASVTYQHVFNAKPSTGNNVTLSSVSWNISATYLNGYNSASYAGVQFGTSKANGSISLTSSSAWGSSGTYNGKTKITEIRLWFNRGGSSVTPSVTIGGVSAVSDGTVVAKNSSAGSDWTKTSKVTFTPGTNGNSGVVVISASSTNAGYICCMEIDCEEPAGGGCTNPGTALSINSANTATIGTNLSLTTTGGNGGSVTWSVEDGTGSATVSGSTLTPVSAGTVTVTATQGENTVSGTTYCGATPTQEITISVPRYTVSFSTGSGNPTQSSIQEASGGSGITLPAGPTPACSGDGWVFMGWKESSAQSSSTTAPDMLAAGMTYKPASNCTLYAVYYKLADSNPNYFTKVTSSSANLTSGYYVIYANGEAMNNVITSNKIEGVTQAETSSGSGIISTSTAAIIWIIYKNGTNYQLYNAAVGKYLEVTGANQLALQTSSKGFTLKAFNTSTGQVSLQSVNKTSYQFQYYSGKFSSYGSQSTAIYFYKRGGTYNSNPTCCTALGSINGSISLTTVNGGKDVKADWSATTGGNETGYHVALYNNANDALVAEDDVATTTKTFSNPGAGTYYVKVTPTYSGAGSYCAEGTVKQSGTIEVSGNVVVTFKRNGGGGAADNQTQEVTYNSATALSTIATIGYTAPTCKQFGGWATSEANATAGTIAYADGANITATGATTLWAVWTNLTYAVTDGTMVGVASHSYSANPITCGNTLTITCAADGDHKGNPTVTATGTHGTITVVSATSVTIANVTSAIAVSISYAEKTNVTATWNVNNGSVTGGGTTTQKEGSTFTFPNVTSTDCGTFLGWTNAANSSYSSTSGTPTPFYTAGSTTTLNENTQFYAVYSKVSDDAVSATLYAHDGNVNSITNAGYTNTTVTPTGISTTNTTNYKTKFDDVGDKVIFQLDGTPTSFSAAFQTPSSGTSGTSTIKLYESSSTSGPWTEITSTSITTSSTSATLSETRPAKFTQRILKLEMTSKGYNMMCGDITIVGLRAPINYTTNPGCVDWVLDAINVTTAPTKTTYDECEEFDPSGMAVTATMKENGNPSNTTTKDVAGYTWTPEQFLTPGNAVAVTISYTEKGVTRTTTQTVKVNDLPNYTITFHDGDGTTTWTQANHCDACDLDSRTGSLACGDYTFAGWSTSSTTYDDENATITTWVSGSYTPTANTHLYAVYRKGATPPAFTANCEGGTFYIYEANGNTHMAGRVNATPRAYTSEYWNNDGGTGCVACLDDGPDLTPFTFTKIAENTYKIQNSAGEYLRKYSSNHPDFESTWYNEDNFKWVISAGTNGTWRFVCKAADTYALVKSGSYFDFQLASNVTPSSSYYDLELEPAASTVYQSNPNCASTYTITFNTHGGTFVQGNYAYATETTSGLSGTTTSKFPSATLSGCTFAGWKEGSVQEEVTSSNEGDAPILIAADANMSVSSNKTYHAVYHYYDEDLEFDPVNGGTYHMYATISGTKHFCSGTPGTSYGVLTSTTDCNDVVDVVITPGTGENVGKYKINIGGYDVSPELNGTGLKRGTFWWNIAEVDDNLYHITADGAESGRSLNYYSTSSAFTHYKDNGAGNTKDISFGRCRQHHWTSEPVLVPMVVLNSNSNIMVTSTNGQTLRSTTMLTVTATHYGETTKIYLSANVAGVGFLKSDGTALSSDAGGSYLQTDAEGELATSVYVTYAPTVTTDGIENVTITARDGHSPSPLSQTTRSAQVRHLPTKFIIAQKVGDDWYALPNDMGNNYTSSTAAVKLSSVNESTGVATFYSEVTDQFAYQLLASKGLDKKGMVFSSPVKSNNIIKANTTSSTSTIGLYAQSGWTGANVQYYEFTPATTDLVDYTIKNTFQNNYLGITTGAWGIGSTNNVRFFSIDQKPAATITWQNDMWDVEHANHTFATNKAENGIVSLPAGTPPSCNEPSELLKFDGWVTETWSGYKTTGFTKVVGGEVATSAVTYHAVFKDANNRYYTQCPTIYSITYTPNGGTGSNYITYTMNTTADAITVGAAGFSKEGSTFVGWTNPSDEDGTIITPGAGKITGLTGDITLNAVWIGTVSVTGTVRLTTAAGEKVATGATDVTISSTDLACATALRITYKDVTNDVTYGRTGSPTYTSSEFRLCNGSYGAADLSNISLAEVSGAYNQTFSITYEPKGGANTLDEYQLKVEVLLKNTVIDTKTLSLYGRTLPASFAIAIKVGGSWYALPNNMGSEGTYDPILISVTEDASVLNWTAQGPSTVAYKMKHYSSNYSKLRFAANDATENCLWAATGNSASIRNWSSSSTASNYAWTVTPDANFNAYTMANLANTRTALKINDSKWEMYNTGGLSEIHFIPLTTVTPIDVTVMEWGVDEIAVKTAANWTPSAITAQISGGSPSAVTKTSIGGDLYKLTGVGDLQGNPGEPLALNVTDGGAKQAIIQIPFIVAPVSPATSETKTEADLADLLVTAGYAGNRSDARNLTKNMDVIVRSGGTLSSSSSTSGTFQNVYIYPGGKADFSKDISIQNIYMRGGFSWLGGAYAHPQMNVASTASISGIGSTGHGIFYDLYLDNSIYYVFALPKDVAVTAITNEENGDDWDAWIKSYSGEGRTLSPKVSGWHYVTSGSIARGAGYEIAIKPRLNRPYGILRFPLLKSTAWSAETDCTPSVKGWGANNANVSDNNKGWNFIGNPFLTAYNNSTTPGSTPSGLIQTQTLVPSSVVPWDGKYVWSSSNVKYFTIPRYTEYEYDDVRAYPYKLDAFFPFFIQATGDGTLSFDDANRALKAPTRYVEETQREVIVDFILQNASGKQDLAGLTICDNYSADFDMNDKEKTIQNGNSVMKVYTMVGEYRTAFNSLPEAAAAQPIPVGYIAPAAGNYSFSLQEGDFSQVEHVWLTDYTESSTVDLLNGIPYQFETAAGTFNERFALNVILRSQQETPTGTGQMEAESDQPQKFIYQEKMYIMRGGVIYDATGKKVCEINK